MTGSASREPRPLEAMREALHLFAREPHARPGQPATAAGDRGWFTRCRPLGRHRRGR